MTDQQEPAYATAAAVTGLAREVEALRRAVDQLRPLQQRLEQLAGMVTRLAEVATPRTTDHKAGTPSWLDVPRDTDSADVVLTELIGWMTKVYLRYADAARTLPECWLWHPDVVEELLWLMHAWVAAYAYDDVPVSYAADLHDRLRPGVVRRIKAVAGQCSLENHDRGRELHLPVLKPPLAAAANDIADWWGPKRTGEPPVPRDTHISSARAYRAMRGRK